MPTVLITGSQRYPGKESLPSENGGAGDDAGRRGEAGRGRRRISPRREKALQRAWILIASVVASSALPMGVVKTPLLETARIHELSATRKTLLVTAVGLDITLHESRVNVRAGSKETIRSVGASQA